MNPQENLKTVQSMYAAFGAGNIQGVLSPLANDAEWTDGGAPLLPFTGTYRGPQGAGEFFKKLLDKQEFLGFEPKEFVTQGDTVVALGYIKAKSKATGKTWESQWAMTFHFQGGKVKKFYSFYDTALAAEAYRR